MKDLRHPAKPSLQIVLNLFDTVNLNENPEEEDYHKYVLFSSFF